VKLIKATYISNTTYFLIAAIISVAVIGEFVPVFYYIAKYSFLFLLVLFFVDLLLLFNNKKGIISNRQVPEKLSNGDENKLFINVKNNYGTKIYLSIIDEIPFVFQKRDFIIRTELEQGAEKTFEYSLFPKERGEYNFGNLNIYARTILGLVKRRYKFDYNASSKVYPSFLQMRKYELMAISNRLSEYGIKKIRKIGNQTEFEQIKEYVQGDDYRTINWKATARKAQLMVNQYQDEKSQDVYSLIDKGRVMKMPFDEMSLLDYAINSSLVLSNISILKDDKAGLITFSNNIDIFLKSEKKSGTISRISEILYNQKTDFLESDYEKIYIAVKRNITKRSLLFLYTNFETMVSLKRHIYILRKIAHLHLLVVVIFDNTELNKMTKISAKTMSDIFIKTTAEKFISEKHQIARELEKNGILSILTSPQELTINAINKYLEIKTRNLI